MNKFKSFIIGLVLAIIAIVPVQAAQPIASTFLGGSGNLVLTNNTTITNAQQNLRFTTKAGTQVLALQTNSVNGELYNGPALLECFTWADANGNVNTNVAVLAVLKSGVADLSTNTIVFTFQRSVDGTNFGTATQDTFVWQWGSGGLSEVIVSTNVPATFLTGTRKIRLKSAVSSNVSSGTNCVIGSLKLCGWAP